MRNRFRCSVVTTAEQMQHAIAARSIVYMEDNGFAHGLTFDGNDFVATHIVYYDGVEPIGSSRIRWFADFAKIERTCLRKSHRNVRNLRAAFQFVCDHAAQKGYTLLLTHADEEYSRLWVKLFGFELLQDRPPLVSPGYKTHFELVKRLKPPVDAIRPDTPPAELSRIEGSWDVPGAWDVPPHAN